MSPQNRAWTNLEVLYFRFFYVTGGLSLGWDEKHLNLRRNFDKVTDFAIWNDDGINFEIDKKIDYEFLPNEYLLSSRRWGVEHKLCNQDRTSLLRELLILLLVHTCRPRRNYGWRSWIGYRSVIWSQQIRIYAVKVNSFVFIFHFHFIKPNKGRNTVLKTTIF